MHVLLDVFLRIACVLIEATRWYHYSKLLSLFPAPQTHFIKHSDLPGRNYYILRNTLMVIYSSTNL